MLLSDQDNMVQHAWFFWDGPPKHPLIRLCLQSLVKHAQDFEVHELNSRNVLEYIPELADPNHGWHRLGYWAQKVDYLRPRILHKYGGIFLDADVIVFRSLNAYFAMLESAVPQATLLGEGNKSNLDLSVGFLVARKGCPIMRAWMLNQDQVLADPHAKVEWETMGRFTLNPALNSGHVVYIDRLQGRPFAWDHNDRYLSLTATVEEHIHPAFPSPIVWPLYWSQLSQKLSLMQGLDENGWLTADFMISKALRVALDVQKSVATK